MRKYASDIFPGEILVFVDINEIHPVERYVIDFVDTDDEGCTRVEGYSVYDGTDFVYTYDVYEEVVTENVDKMSRLL